jgi:hypothetical protein
MCVRTCNANADADDEAPKEGGELDDKAWRAMEREAEGVALGNGTENLQEVRPPMFYAGFTSTS